MRLLVEPERKSWWRATEVRRQRLERRNQALHVVGGTVVDHVQIDGHERRTMGGGRNPPMMM